MADPGAFSDSSSNPSPRKGQDEPATSTVPGTDGTSILLFQGITLSTACSQGRLGAAMVLWQMGADIEKADSNGTTPLHNASFNGHLPIVKLLLDKGAAIDVRRTSATAEADTQQTPLMWAICAGHYGVVRHLVEQGADLSLVDNQGHSAVVHAVHYDRADMIVWFKERLGASVHVVDKQGHNTAQWAAYKGHLATLRLLHEKYQVPLEQVDHEGRTSLHWAAKQGHAKVVEYLLSRGCSKATKDRAGLTALDLAESDGGLLVVNTLHGRGYDPLCGNKYTSTLSRLTQCVFFRTFALSVMSISFAFFCFTKYAPVWMSYVFVPLCGTAPPVVDSMLFMSRRPTPKPRRYAPWSPGNCFSELADPCDHNMAHFAFVAAIQILLPWHLFGESGVGVYAAATYPNWFRALQVSVGLAWLLWLRCVMSQPRSPSGLPDLDIEREKPALAQGRYEYQTMQRKCLRSFYCPFTNTVVCGYEYFSTALDTCVGDGNKVSVVLWELVTALWSGIMVWLTFLWIESGAAGGAPVAPTFTVCRVGWRLLTTAMPTGVLLQGEPKNFPWSLSPTPQQFTALWTFVVAGAVCVFATVHGLLHITLWMNGLTYNEMYLEKKGMNPVPVPSGLAGTRRKGGWSRFHTGSRLRNLADVLFGGTSRYWRMLEHSDP
eukprot:TRINITY_DN30808_c0_g1_i1.p1 TRINITY_DN30808_c0_g1~~TRINITY_DN30808_c0_g1_i1.p1  ORF type:complete len:682 (+),score=218.68 TRINITY_DN30808_c0_g1_i1:65-2047(+)